MFDYENIAVKIKFLAKIINGVGIAISVILGILCFFAMIPLGGILIILFGVIASWFGSLLIYGFGQLIENTDRLVVLNKYKSAQGEKNQPTKIPKFERTSEKNPDEDFLRDVFETQ